MNKVYLSGQVASRPVLTGGEAAHLIFDLSVSHRTAKNEVRRELYRINAWHASAQWGYQNLLQGEAIALQGYLTQHAAPLESGGTARMVEVTAEEFFAGMKLKREAAAPAEEKPVQPKTSEAEAAEM